MLLAETPQERSEVERAVAALLIGFRIDAVHYLHPAAMHGRGNLRGLGFEHAEAGLTLTNRDGDARSVRWGQSGFDEGLCVGESLEKESGLWVPDVDTIPVGSWTLFEGSTISSIAFAWQRIASTRFSIWSVRLDVGDQSVAIALGERDPDSGRLTYIPDCVVVIFEEAIGRHYCPRPSLSSAWGEDAAETSVSNPRDELTET